MSGREISDFLQVVHRWALSVATILFVVKNSNS